MATNGIKDPIQARVLAYLAQTTRTSLDMQEAKDILAAFKRGDACNLNLVNAAYLIVNPDGLNPNELANVDTGAAMNRKKFLVSSNVPHKEFYSEHQNEYGNYAKQPEQEQQCEFAVGLGKEVKQVVHPLEGGAVMLPVRQPTKEESEAMAKMKFVTTPGFLCPHCADAHHPHWYNLEAGDITCTCGCRFKYQRSDDERSYSVQKYPLAR